MKILLTTHQFLPDFSAGTEILTYSVARELIARGHNVVVMTGFPNKAAFLDDKRLDEYDHDGIHVYRFNHANVPMGSQTSKLELEFDNKLAANFFKELLVSFSPDIVHFFHFARLGTALISISNEMGIPAFLTPTDFWSICPNGRLTYANGTGCKGPSRQAGNCALHLAAQKSGPTAEGLVSRIPTVIIDTLAGIARSNLNPSTLIRDELASIKRRLPINIERLNTLSKIIAPNRMIESSLIQHGVDEEKITRSAYGIDLNSSLLKAPRKRASQLRIGFIGTLAPHKGCHTLIDAFNALKEYQATLKVYGNQLDFPKYSKMLTRKAKHNQSIKFHGTFPNKDMAYILAELDVLVVPSTWPENTPLIIYSAQAAGCPVVASNVPGIAEAVRHGVDGLLFQQGDALDLYSCLLRLIQEPTLLEDLSANTVRPRSSSDYVDDLLNIWTANSPTVRH